MALYAFDGTWNSDKPGSDLDTNVARFRHGYTEKAFYWPGVGTRFGKVGQIVGGLTGAGGRTRVDEAFEQAVDNLGAGQEFPPIRGVSRKINSLRMNCRLASRNVL